ncbi:MAG TPA: hypothetical protein PKU78_06660 [Candidatus Dojkabacteria bacterium]|nr:hypothetical protein [Candidatus Dojkabacteria bacterium]
MTTYSGCDTIFSGKELPRADVIYKNYLYSFRVSNYQSAVIPEIGADETIIWIHSNENSTDNSIILTQTSLYKIEKKCVISQISLDKIHTLSHIKNNILRWDKLGINSSINDTPNINDIPKESLGIKPTKAIGLWIEVLRLIKPEIKLASESTTQTNTTGVILGGTVGTALGAAAGSAAAVGVYSMVATVGVASTGTAISSLSGAAATTATLAALGGGMLTGVAVLSTVVAVPVAVIGITGSVVGLHIQKQLKGRGASS